MPDIKLKEKAMHGSALMPVQFYQPWNSAEKVIVPLHWHDEIEIIYVEKGTLIAEKNLEKQTFSTGEFCFFSKGDLHRLYAEDYGVIHYAVVFNLNMLSFELFDEAQSNVIAPLLSGEMKFPYKLDGSMKLRNEYMELVRTIWEKRRNWYFSAKVCLLKIVSILLEEKHMITDNMPKTTEPYRLEMIKKSIGFIQKNYAEKIYLEQLAAEINLNPQYFCRFFKEATGKQPIEYINSYRIEQAVMLLGTDKPFIEIAGLCGFENYSYFIKKFKQYKDCTPAEYRKKLLTKQ